MPDRPRWGLGWAAVALAGFFTSSVVLLAPVVVWMAATGNDSLDGLELAGIAAGGGGALFAFVLIPWLVSRYRGAGSLRADYGLAFRRNDLAWGPLAAAAMLAGQGSLILGWRALSGDQPEGNVADIASAISPLSLVAVFAVVGIAVPFAEELYFRGMLLRALTRRLGGVAAVTVSSLIFGFCHFALSGSLLSSLFVVAVTSLMGAVLAWMVKRTGRLGAAIIAHMLWNSAVVALLAVAVLWAT